MKQSVDIWNTLHDGEIIRAERRGNNAISILVEIEYLVERLFPGEDSIWINLIGCSGIRFRPYASESPITDLSQLSELGIIILSAEHEEAAVMVTCVDGQLVLSYSSASFSSASGVEFSYDKISEASDSYWDEWSKVNNEDA